jgi:hypothetical protein
MHFQRITLICIVLFAVAVNAVTNIAPAPVPAPALHLLQRQT